MTREQLEHLIRAAATVKADLAVLEKARASIERAFR